MRLSNNLESLELRTAEEVVDQSLAGAYADGACFHMQLPRRKT